MWMGILLFVFFFCLESTFALCSTNPTLTTLNAENIKKNTLWIFPSHEHVPDWILRAWIYWLHLWQEMYQGLSSGLKPGTEWSASAFSFQDEMTISKLPVWKFPGSNS